MTIRFLLIIIITAVAFAGCAKPPLAELETARYLVRDAAEVGAADWSPGEYRLAKAALEAAEEQMKKQQYRAAARTISLAQRYAKDARSESERALKRLAELERQRAETARLQEDKRLRELAEQEAALRQRELEQRRREEARQAAARTASAASAAKPAPPPPVLPSEPDKVQRYEVLAGQNLAEIANLPEVYGDRLLWPLIYRANRDQIKTPQEIAPGQVLDIPRDKNSEELEAARKEARELNLF
jgi:nucleoid-associated protein YgaU